MSIRTRTSGIMVNVNVLPAPAAVSGMSLVLVAASNQYLSRTWGNSPTSTQIGTFSFFVKRASLPGLAMSLIDGGPWNAGSGRSECRFSGGTGNQLDHRLDDGSSILENVTSNETVS